ncbi:hypothetical protein AKJ16_DCAP03598 [Drosera capensis]
MSSLLRHGGGATSLLPRLLLLRRTLPRTPTSSTLSSPQIIPPRTLDTITSPTPFSDSDSDSPLLHFPVYAADVSNSGSRGGVCFVCPSTTIPSLRQFVPEGSKERGEVERLGVLDRIIVEGVLNPCGMPSLEFFLPDGNDPDETMILFPKRTFQPSTLRRKRNHGFFARYDSVLPLSQALQGNKRWPESDRTKNSKGKVENYSIASLSSKLVNLKIVSFRCAVLMKEI